MRLATICRNDQETKVKSQTGELVVVSDDGATGAIVNQDSYSSLLEALSSWKNAKPYLQTIYDDLKNGSAKNIVKLSDQKLLAPIPKTYALLDGSAFIQHIVLVRKARGAELPKDLHDIPLMYQGLSDNLLGPTDPIPLADESYGLDFEGEFCVVVDEVPMGTVASDADKHIKLLLLMNDVSLRGLIPRELETGFGFFHGKPASAFAPFALTPDELGDSWKDGRVYLELSCDFNGQKFGRANGSEMHFSFYDLIEHAAKTRSLSAGTIIGSGTVSNKDTSVGSSCIAEKRTLEQITMGEITTPFMKPGDLIEMEALLNDRSVFGKLQQKAIQRSS